MPIIGDTMRTFEIYFSDLNEDAQNALCAEFDTTEEDENWEYQALASIDREECGETDGD